MGNFMSNETGLSTRIMAAAGAVTMSLAIMVSYFAAPSFHAASSMLV
jgi:hypothetical protein